MPGTGKSCHPSQTRIPAERGFCLDEYGGFEVYAVRVLSCHFEQKITVWRLDPIPFFSMSDFGRQVI